ncbi:MAG: arginine--tRNA ligase [Parcubacteria group bacterium]
MNILKYKLAKIISKALDIEITPNDFALPPSETMGDLSLPCFELAKKLKKNPKEAAEEIVQRLEGQNIVLSGQIDKIETAGPFVNFFVSAKYLAENVFAKNFGKIKSAREKIMIEYATPNTHKIFHIGHLRNTITGESLARVLENVGSKVIRANYQGDVGLHIAKALYGIDRLKKEYAEAKKKNLTEKIEFLSRAYVLGAEAHENDRPSQELRPAGESAREQIYGFNKKIYDGDKTIRDIYKTTRKWSLEYFDKIYKRLGTRFNRFYFESETFADGKKIVEKFLEKGVFKKSQGAVIFEGEKHGLHNRVFITSDGFPTYEAKDLALAKMQFKEYRPDKIFHIVSKEQTEYFKVLFKALEFTLPKSIGKEFHLPYGWITLKSGKMSSRTGQVVAGEWLLNEIEKRVAEIMMEIKFKAQNSKPKKEDEREIVEKVALSAVKYSMLKIGIGVDMVFDFQESVSLSGDSGPYLLYICARIKSILEKLKTQSSKHKINLKLKVQNFKINSIEKALLIKLNNFTEAETEAAAEMDPSKVAKYLFELAQCFNTFYQECPILKAEDEVQTFRVELIKSVRKTMEKGLDLLGIEIVDKM